MNAIGVSRDGAWSQFLKLTQEARVRNSGLSSTSEKSAVSSSKSAPVRSNTTPLILNGVSYNKSKPDVKKVILGGKFDAYA